MSGLVAVIGPTAVGKSRLALHLAQKFNGEIVNADSRQVYRFMDIGTAKPDKLQRASIPHHLVDIIDPDEPFSLAIFKKLASEAIRNIQRKNKVPILVGGSGLYIWSVIEGWTIPGVPPNTKFRKEMENIAHKKGIQFLFQELRDIDPIAADKIMPTNLRRIIRALEIYNASGKPPSGFWHKKPLQIPVLLIGVTADRKILYEMIDCRVDNMIACGLVDEVKNLITRGYSLDLPSMSGIGYHQIGMFLSNKLSLPEAIQQIKYDTHKFVRRQYTWFQLADTRIQWLDVCDNIQEHVDAAIEVFLHRSKQEG
jgi:tRNA dimethylallyltransferase